MTEMKQETKQGAQYEQTPEDQVERAMQVTCALQAWASYEPGEQEAVARVAHDAGLIVTAIQKTKRRHLQQSCKTAVILTVWLWYCIECATPIVRWVIGLFWNVEAYQDYLRYLMPLFCAPGHLAAILAGLGIYYYNDSRQCQEIGEYIQVGRKKIATHIMAAVGLLLAMNPLMLIAVRQSRSTVTMRDFLIVANLTAFTTTLLGCLITVFSIKSFYMTRSQMMEDEKIKLGIFD